MFGASKFNKANQDEEEINKSVKKYDLTEKEVNEEPSKEKNTSNKSLRPSLNKPSNEEKTEKVVNRPNISRGRPSINRNSSYNREDTPEISVSKDIPFGSTEGTVNSDDFIKEEEVVNKKINNRPVVKRKNRNSSNNYTYSSKNEYFNEDKKMAANGLPLRLDKLIDVVSDHQGLDVNTIKEIKKKALTNPDSLMKEYENIFMTEIKPNIDSRHRTLEDAKKQHPDKIVFMFIKDGKQLFKALDKEKANGYEAYDGLVIETMSSSRTPFGPANIVFAKDEPKIIDESDDAFEESPQTPQEDKNIDQSENQGDSFEDDVDLTAKPPTNSFKP